MVDCISCKRSVRNDREATRFACPSCGKIEIVRCGQCRKSGIQYACSECEFIGP